jgi:hypothetical protein
MSSKKASALSGFLDANSLFAQYQLDDKGGYITQEFQDFGYRLAMELDDKAHTSLYMRLSKNTDRLLLEKALGFVKDAQNAKNKAALFMWKLKKLKEENKVKISQPNAKTQDKK